MWLGILTLLIIPFFVALSVSFAEKKPTQNKMATVNGNTITKEELDREVANVLMEFAKKGNPIDESRIGDVKRDVLEGLINRELLIQGGKKKGIKIQEKAINDRFQAVKGRFPNEEEYKNALIKGNLNEKTLKTLIEKGLIIEEFLSKEIMQKVNVSPEEVKTYYDSHPELFKRSEQVRASHILLKVDPKADQAQKAKIKKDLENIHKKLKKGGDFAALAKQYSQCPSNEKGGDIGFIGKGQTAKAFEETAFALKPNEMSGVIETEFGCHIIKVTEKKPESTVSFDETKDRILTNLKEMKIRNDTTKYIEEVKKKAKIERFLTEAK
jgi:peptidyl-prolyl cis-trans isomerase C